RKLIYIDEFYVSQKMITLNNIYNLLKTNSKLNIDTLELKQLSCRPIDIEKNKKDATKNFSYITIMVPRKNSKIPAVGKYPKILNQGLGYPPNYLVENSGLAFSPNILLKDTIATGLSWLDIEKIVKAIHKNVRVITEAEWEYLFRSDSTSIYPWGNQKIPDDSIIVYLEEKADDIGVYFDPAYYEWCNGWYNRDYYQREVIENPLGSEIGDKRILRSAGKMRCSDKYLLGYREYAKMISYIGFRVVLPVL
ncbi:MAG: formylglycine-generating enzyme family protein, partial [Candidatus Hodarchaeota archaeon]